MYWPSIEAYWNWQGQQKLAGLFKDTPRTCFQCREKVTGINTIIPLWNCFVCHVECLNDLLIFLEENYSDLLKKRLDIGKIIELVVEDQIKQLKDKQTND